MKEWQLRLLLFIIGIIMVYFLSWYWYAGCELILTNWVKQATNFIVTVFGGTLTFGLFLVTFVSWKIK